MAGNRQPLGDNLAAFIVAHRYEGWDDVRGGSKPTLNVNTLQCFRCSAVEKAEMLCPSVE